MKKYTLFIFVLLILPHIEQAAKADVCRELFPMALCNTLNRSSFIGDCRDGEDLSERTLCKVINKIDMSLFRKQESPSLAPKVRKIERTGGREKGLCEASVHSTLFPLFCEPFLQGVENPNSSCETVRTYHRMVDDAQMKLDRLIVNLEKRLAQTIDEGEAGELKKEKKELQRNKEDAEKRREGILKIKLSEFNSLKLCEFGKYFAGLKAKQEVSKLIIKAEQIGHFNNKEPSHKNCGVPGKLGNDDDVDDSESYALALSRNRSGPDSEAEQEKIYQPPSYEELEEDGDNLINNDGDSIGPGKIITLENPLEVPPPAPREATDDEEHRRQRSIHLEAEWNPLPSRIGQLPVDEATIADEAPKTALRIVTKIGLKGLLENSTGKKGRFSKSLINKLNELWTNDPSLGRFLASEKDHSIVKAILKQGDPVAQFKRDIRELVAGSDQRQIRLRVLTFLKLSTSFYDSGLGFHRSDSSGKLALLNRALQKLEEDSKDDRVISMKYCKLRPLLIKVGRDKY